MNRIIHLIIAAGLIILVGTIVEYNIESKVPNTQIKTYLDALWWCVATVTTVGYGDIVPVSNLGRIVAVFYMFFGIALLFGGSASIVEGFSGKESGWKRAFLIGVGALLIIIGIITLVSPVFGAAFAGFIIAIGLLIAGIEMIAAGATGRKLNLPSKDNVDSLTGKK